MSETASDSALSRNGILMTLGVVVITAVIGVVIAPDMTVHILGFCMTICVFLFGLLKLDSAAQKVEQVKQTLAVATTEVAAATQKQAIMLGQVSLTVDKVHQLTNSAHGVSLKLTAELSRWKAEQTNEPGDIQAASDAEKASVQHEQAQARVDAGSQGAAAASTPLDEVVSDVKAVVSEVRDAMKEAKGKL